MGKEFKFAVKKAKKGYLFKSENRGFNGLELVGLLSMKLHDLQRQQSGEVKPKVKYDRTVVVKRKAKNK